MYFHHRRRQPTNRAGSSGHPTKLTNLYYL
uniref:Uncharacterized protein n=1 Tax=Rhizophora mucronata TaxID=61149 RepID=A0A2P2N419_RHIMU